MIADYKMSSPQKGIKLRYLPCKIKSHEGQTLNLVCIGCDHPGLICSLCRQQHLTHRVLPLKILLHNLTNQLQLPPQDEHYCQHMQMLENIKNSTLLQLKCSVENLARMFEGVEQSIMDAYNHAKMQVIQQIQLGLEVDSLAHGLVSGTISELHFEQSIRKLAHYVQPSSDAYLLSIDFEKTLRPLKLLQDHLHAQLKLIEDFTATHLSFQEITKPTQPQPKLPTQIYRFSPHLKGTSVQLNENRTLAKQSETTSSRFALIEEGAGLKSRSITFKVVSLKNWIGVGVALKDKITAVDYAFKYQNMGHGSFLLSNNGYTWSHAYPQDNIHPCLFTFKQDSTIKVTLTEKELIFKVSDTPSDFKLKISYKEEEWPNVCFCANLCSQEDSIQILDQ